MKESVWTKPVVARFEQLFEDELPYSKIAEELSKEFGVLISRNAAIGFARRHNVPKRQKTDTPRKQERFEPRGKTTLVQYIPKKPTGRGILRIDQLGPRSCRWPFGDNPPFLYCGCLTVEGYPYCETHMKLGHVRWQPVTAA